MNARAVVARLGVENKMSEVKTSAADLTKEAMSVRPFPPIRSDETIYVDGERVKSINAHCVAMMREIQRLRVGRVGA